MQTQSLKSETKTPERRCYVEMNINPTFSVCCREAQSRNGRSACSGEGEAIPARVQGHWRREHQSEVA